MSNGGQGPDLLTVSLPLEGSAGGLSTDKVEAGL